MNHVWDRREMHAGFWYENLKGTDQLEDLGLGRRMTIKLVPKV
jgi:hypothetical protein